MPDVEWPNDGIWTASGNTILLADADGARGRVLSGDGTTLAVFRAADPGHFFGLDSFLDQNGERA